MNGGIHMKNLNKLMNECMKELDKLKIPYTKPQSIKYDNAKKRWGLCRKIDDCHYEISITKRLSNDEIPDDSIKSVIITVLFSLKYLKPFRKSSIFIIFLPASCILFI